jgi:hypothetical protein
MTEKLLSLVTFFAAAMKVTAAPHRGEQIDRERYKFHGSKTASNGLRNRRPERKRPPCAKKVTAPHRGEQTDRERYKFHGSKSASNGLRNTRPEREASSAEAHRNQTV